MVYCPVCRDINFLRTSNYDELPSNYTIITIMDMLGRGQAAVGEEQSDNTNGQPSHQAGEGVPDVQQEQPVQRGQQVPAVVHNSAIVTSRYSDKTYIVPSVMEVPMEHEGLPNPEPGFSGYAQSMDQHTGRDGRTQDGRSQKTTGNLTKKRAVD